MKIIKRQDVEPKQWDALAEQSPEAGFWHLHALGDLFGSEWSKEDNLSFALKDQERLLGIFPVQLLKEKELESLGGPAFQLGAEDRVGVESKLFDFFSHLGEQHRVQKCRVSLPALASGENLQRWGFQTEAGRLWSLNLKNDLQTMGELPGYSLREARGPKDLEMLYTLHEHLCRRRGEVSYPKKYFRILFEAIVPQQRARVLFLLNEGRLIAAHIMGLFKTRAVAWMEAQIDSVPPEAIQRLRQAQILEAKRRGLVHFELKEAGFGAEPVAFWRGSLEARGVRRWLAFLGFFPYKLTHESDTRHGRSGGHRI